MAFPVLFDACVLIPMPYADLILRLAERHMFQPLWSEQILEEVERNLVAQLELPSEDAKRRVSAMRKHFPGAIVEGHEGLMNAMTNDPKDRHVLAAAVRANVALLVTDNVKDFPPRALAPYTISSVTTDEFLLDQLDLDARAVQVHPVART